MSKKNIIDLLSLVIVIPIVLLIGYYIYKVNNNDNEYFFNKTVEYYGECNCKVNSISNTGVYIFCEITKETMGGNGIKYGPDSLLIGGIKLKDLKFCK